MSEQKISELSGFLSTSPRSYNEVARFLTLRVLDNYKPISLHIAELIETGVLRPLGSFGYESQGVENFQGISLQEKTPMSLAVSSNNVVVVVNTVENLKIYTTYDLMGANPDWKSLVSVPAYPSGCFTFLSSVCLEDEEIDTFFLTAVGSLIGLYGRFAPLASVAKTRVTKEQSTIEGSPLTQRQKIIAGKLERGFSNLDISEEIGFSESLVRQESMAIYQKLNVTGRKAMQAIHNLKLEKLVSDISIEQQNLLADD